MGLTGEAIGRFVFIICFRIFPRFQPFLIGLEDFLGGLEDFVFVFVFFYIFKILILLNRIGSFSLALGIIKNGENFYHGYGGF